MGSQNMIDFSYLLPANLKVGRHWKDLNVKISGVIIMELEAVFAMDWYTETGDQLGLELELVDDPGADKVSTQLLPSGPMYLTIPNLRLFTGLVHRAQEKLSLTSPYFVPDDSWLEAITTAAYRGVAVELFLCEQADQFVILCAPSPLGIDARHDQGSTVVRTVDCCTLEDGDADIPDLQSPPPMNRGFQLQVWIRDSDRSVHALPGSSEPTPGGNACRWSRSRNWSDTAAQRSPIGVPAPAAAGDSDRCDRYGPAVQREP